MYFSNAPHIIEANDIDALRSVKVERLSDGSIVAHLDLQLKPSKDYVDAPSLHVTDGVSHRMLDPMPVPVVEDTSTTASKGKKAAKQEESASDAS